MPVVKLDYANATILDGQISRINLDTVGSFTGTTVTMSSVWDMVFKFDLGLIPNNAIINSAKLSVGVSTPSSQTGTKPLAYNILNDWNVSDITGNKLQLSTVAHDTGIEIPGAAGNFLLDITPIAQSWVSDVNNGVLFRAGVKANGDVGSSVLISTESKTVNSPTLTIDYSIPTEDKKQVEYITKNAGVLPSSGINLLPNGILKGDLIVTSVNHTSTYPMENVQGWNTLSSANMGGTGWHTVLYKFAEGGETQSELAFNADATNRYAQNTVYRNVKAVHKVADNPKRLTNANIVPDPVSDLPINSMLLLVSFLYNQSATFTQPLGFTEFNDSPGSGVAGSVSGTYTHNKTSYASNEITVVASISAISGIYPIALIPITNQAPTIDGQDGDLGAINAALLKAYTVTDTEGETITITEKVDGTILRTYEGTGPQTLDLSTVWANLSVGKHTVTIEANDTYDVTRKYVRTWTFLKILNPNDDLLTATKGLVDLVPHLKGIKQMLVDKVGGSVLDKFEDIIESFGFSTSMEITSSGVNHSFTSYVGSVAAFPYIDINMANIPFIPSKIVVYKKDLGDYRMTTYNKKDFYVSGVNKSNTGFSNGAIQAYPSGGVLRLPVIATNAAHTVEIYR